MYIKYISSLNLYAHFNLLNSISIFKAISQSFTLFGCAKNI